MLDTLVCAGVTLCSLRATCLAGATLCFLGAAVRCFPLDAAASTGMIHLGQFFNGLAGPIAMAAGPVLSATWFPPHQRTTATAIQITSNYVGVSISFVLGPNLVAHAPAHPGAHDIHHMKTDILHYMWMHAAFAAVVLVATIVCFPSHPPNAPSRSAETSRVSFVSGLKQLVVKRQFWIIALAYGMMTGVCSG